MSSFIHQVANPNSIPNDPMYVDDHMDVEGIEVMEAPSVPLCKYCHGAVHKNIKVARKCMQTHHRPLNYDFEFIVGKPAACKKLIF